MSASRQRLKTKVPWFPQGFLQPITVSIVDDDPVGRQALRQIMRRADMFTCVSVYPSAWEALADLPSLNPQVVLMDIRMPGISGIECTRRLKMLLPKTKVVVITALVDTQTMSQALRAGADGYLTKPFTVSECVQAIRLALCGGIPMSKAMTAELEAHLARQSHPFVGHAHPGLAKLTTREMAVLQLLAEGLQYKEIADHLRQSVYLVQKLVHNIYRKLEVQNRTEAVNKWRWLNPLSSARSGKTSVHLVQY